MSRLTLCNDDADRHLTKAVEKAGGREKGAWKSEEGSGRYYAVGRAAARTDLSFVLVLSLHLTNLLPRLFLLGITELLTEHYRRDAHCLHSRFPCSFFSCAS